MTNPNDPAFSGECDQIFSNPITHGNAYITIKMPGLTKREYFAAMAMQGILANPENKKQIERSLKEGQNGEDFIASWACVSADAIIAELNKHG